MQPYFFPYLEYFRLINCCDLWIAFDTAQFSRGSWINRNRIINRQTGWSYISVPIHRDGLQTSINDARIDFTRDWRHNITKKIQTYEPFAPHYLVISKMVTETLNLSVDTLGPFNTYMIKKLCRLLDIHTEIVALSEMNLSPRKPDGPGGWPLHLCKELGAEEYLNASGGRHLYNPELFRRHGITLRFHEHIDLRYDTGPFEFLPDLSIIDVLMWVDMQTLRDVIHGNNASGPPRR